MRAVSHKVKTYRREFRFIPGFMFATSIFWLVFTHTALTLGAIGLYFTSYYVYGSTLFLHLPFHALAWELVLMMGWMQLALEANRRRVMRMRGLAKPPMFRVALAAMDVEKRRRINALFGPHESSTALARDLIQQWEWERSIYQQAASPALQRALGFFNVPSAGNFATYLAGVLAVVAGIVIALIDRDVFFDGVGQLWSNFKEAYSFLLMVVVIPVATLVIPVAMLTDGVRTVTNRIVEWINDDYLSRGRFYAFIKDLIQFETHSQRRLLMRTTGVAFWTMRIGTAPITRVPALWKNMRRSIRIRRRRRNRT
ncbi:hypothetical protein ACP4J5_12440 [Pseudomonas oryzihabitans]|uniref:hypothetical protein n=1 Tax=Pseudomonas oryzihabitans TaxID=47885 RepID=UPI003CF4A0D8